MNKQQNLENKRVDCKLLKPKQLTADASTPAPSQMGWGQSLNMTIRSGFLFVPTLSRGETARKDGAPRFVFKISKKAKGATRWLRLDTPRTETCSRAPLQKLIYIQDSKRR